jgi:hypothetical protein
MFGFPQVEQATLYGSRAMRPFRPGSDIDLPLSSADLDFRTLVQLDAALNSVAALEV